MTQFRMRTINSTACCRSARFYIPLKRLQGFAMQMLGRNATFVYYLFEKSDFTAMLTQAGFMIDEVLAHDLPVGRFCWNGRDCEEGVIISLLPLIGRRRACLPDRQG